jgi:hypothetical protein
MITYLIIRDPDKFVQRWIESEKALALRASLEAAPAPEPEHIPTRLQKRMARIERDLAKLLPTAPPAKAVITPDTATAAKRNARRQAKKNRRMYKQVTFKKETVL